MTTLYLTSKDFHVRGSLLGVKVPSGNVIVLFKQNGCPACAAFEPTFQTCAQNEPRIEWGVVDVDKWPDIIKMSRATKNPIKKVPHLVIFIGGTITAIYTNQDRSVHAVLGFVNEILKMQGINGQRGVPATTATKSASPVYGREKQPAEDELPNQHPTYKTVSQSETASTLSWGGLCSLQHSLGIRH
ncbi:putative thioredoxin [Golden Marseillevirus]|uniref:putative thioredoxin n=1 Tax=Golden Marseillevirus TaxID=1720526 RepID=UPI000877ADD5|nr:putative thioredoxin [Golden Marseillevirus]ALX27581.1 putative thioredoxin [Golden Marseillevirus]